MILTRTWLNNFLDISKVSNETLYERLNSIGLEVDSIKKYDIPAKVVIGKILSCEKHPDADKLNVCQIDIGSGVRQIVCGASNVVDAEYVAVATVGAKLGEDFEIKHAKLRGVDSEGMVCSASELGLPNIGNGIMILDDSIGELVIGKELNKYDKLCDTVIEIELTANRGDCLSVHGVARDLSASLNIPMNRFDYESQNPAKIGLARVAKLVAKGDIEASVQYVIANMEELYTSLLFSIRLGFIEKLKDDALHNVLTYITHSTGVILRAYDVKDIDFENGEKLTINLDKEDDIVNVMINDKLYSKIGINHIKELEATQESSKVLFETSYMNPTLLIDLVAKHKLETDELFYNTSRGSEPNLCFGINYLTYLFESYTKCKLFDGTISLDEDMEDKIITVSSTEISQLIGNSIDKIEIVTILTNLGFKVQSTAEDKFGVTIPRYRHDIENIQDITEEIVRMIGINNIEAKALEFKEAQSINVTMDRYYAKKALRYSAISGGFDESISYAFSDKVLLEKYNFPIIDEELDIINPITSDFNTLRTTTIINLLQAVERNVSYSKKRVALFEIGTIFNSKREEREVLSLIYSGQSQTEYVANAGKPKNIDFDLFVKKLSAVIGNFELRTSNQKNSLINPYQSADIIINNEVCGFLTKVHPNVCDDFDIPDTFVAEIDFDALLPKHINAHAISKFQGVYKDLSLVIDKDIPYSNISNIIKLLNLPLLNRFYAIDVYEDEKLGEEKSLTIRLFIQSLKDTLHDKDIDSTVNAIIEALHSEYGAKLR